MSKTNFTFQYAILFLFSYLHAINPPQSGAFPIGFWDQMESQEIGSVYGDSGWVSKIARWRDGDLRDAQLEFNMPVLLGKYSNTTTYFTAQDFQNTLFDDNATGTMSDYYDEISHGGFTVDGTAHGWYQSTYTMSEAKANTKQYVSEIAQLSDPDVDFSQFDNDGPDNIPNSGDDDGYVDGIAVVYSGCGAEWGPGNDNLWPHMSSLGSYDYTTGDASANGGYVIVSSYFVAPELAGGGDCYTDIIRPMGVYAHEFGHILGLPDLYDRNDGNGSSEGIGNWCLMAGGSWNGWAGDTPAHMSAWCKQEMGWIDPVVLDDDQSGLSIPDAENNAYALKIWEDDYQWSRYFLVENRQMTGYDAGLPASGLMVYHVDENRRYGSHRWSSGPVNDDHLHKFIDVEAADGNADMDNGVNRGDDGDPFPGSSNNIDFSSNSNPNSHRYTGDATDIVVTSISGSSSTMSADISLESQKGIPIVYDHAGMSGSGWGYSSEQDHYGGVLFEYPSTEEQNGYLTEVDIGFRYSESSYVLYVYDSFDGSAPGNLLYEISGTANSPGWHSIPIDSVSIQPGQEFFVTHKIVDHTYAISFDKLTAPAYRSYFSGDGASYSGSIGDSYNINLRAKLRNHVPNLDLSGCTDPYASNYDPDATIDDGSCYGYPDNGEYSLSFDGVDDGVYVDNNYNLLPMSMQVSFKGNFSGVHNGIITTDTPGQYGQSIDVHNGNLGVEVQNEFYYSDIEVSNDTWYDATAVFTDGAVKLYIDGVLELDQSFSQAANDNVSGMYFGRYTQDGNLYFANVVISHAAIWDRALSIEEVQNGFNSELSGDEDGLVGLWKFDAGEGEILYDHTGNANHGNINGAIFVENNPTFANIQVEPDSMYQYLLVGEQADQTLTIYNNGDVDLDWELNITDALGRTMVMGSSTSFQQSALDRNRPSNEGPGAPNSSELAVRPFLGRDPGGRDGDLNVLLLSNNEGNNTTFADQMLAYMDNVDFSSWNATSSIPELDYLEQFDLVMLYENGLFSNSANVGDVVAEYVLNGGSLLLSTFYWQNRTGGGFSGNWGDLESIDPLWDGSCRYSASSLGTIIDHPLTEGVNSLSGGNYRGGPVTLRDNATAVAWWSDGDPLIVYNQPGGTITAVTMGPAWVGSGDWHQVWANAINWTANTEPDWLSVDVISGTIAAGSSQQVTVSFNATELDTGDYHAQLEISSNDPEHSLVSVPIHMDVDMLFPDIDVSPDSLDEELYVGESSTQILTVYNNGEADLDWSAYVMFSESSRIIDGSPEFGPGVPSSDRKIVNEHRVMLNSQNKEERYTSEPIDHLRSNNDSEASRSQRNNQDLDNILESLNENFTSINGIIPNRYDFLDGITGTYIVDGGNDMYDGGNILNTSIGTSIAYSQDEIALHSYLGEGGQYFTRKYDGLFVFAADINGIEYFEITGDLGSDGQGNTDGAILEMDLHGKTYYGFVNRIYNAYDPSVNHLVIVEAQDGLTHSFPSTTHNEGHRVSGLEETTQIFYLLYAGSNGYYIDDEATLAIMDAFLNSIDLRPEWLSLSTQSGTIPVGESEMLDVVFDANAIDEGDYSAVIGIMSNDEDQPELLIPVGLIANVPYPNILLETGSMDVDLFVGDSAARSIVIGNDGVADLNWSVDILDYGRDGTFYAFDDCGGAGHEGPSQEDCDDTYEGTSLQGNVTVSGGSQQWTVPQSGDYTIEVFGAQGGGETGAGVAGGLGARMSGTFYLEEGEELNILVGQMGIAEGQHNYGYAGGGGGGSFVTRGPHDSNESILIVAGGGGGSGSDYQGYDAIIETYDDNTGAEGQGGVPGSNGNSGAGFFGDGVFGGHNGATIAYSYVNGAMGGIGASGGGTGYGGFGGGAGDGYADGGGGGGYSGGNGYENLYGGWGGSSFNNGEDQDNEAAAGSGPGLVVITLDNPTMTWISTSQNSGVVPVGETDTLHVHFNASDLEEGDYLADINLLSDDPDDPDIDIPASLTVYEDVVLSEMPDTSVMEDGMLDLAIDVDYPGYEHQLSATSDTSGIEISVVGDTIGLLPIPDWTGDASIEVILTVGNSFADTTEFVLEVVAVNDPPNAFDHTYYINEDDSLVTYLPADDGDSLNGEHDEQLLTFTAMSSFQHGAFSLGRDDGLLTYDPNPDYFGPDSMEYLLMDDGMTNGEYDALMDTGMIVINILPVNDDPVLEHLSDTTMHEDSTLMVVVSASDVDNDELTLDVSLSIDDYVTAYIEDEVLHLNSHFNWSGSVDVTVLASDNMGRAVDVEQFLLTVLPVNDPPEFDHLHALVGVGMDFELPVTASDIDSESLVISLDQTWTYPEWISYEDDPFRLIGNAPDEGDHHLPLLVDDGELVVSDTFHLESRYFEPRISSVMDVPDDEGGRVYVEFERSFFDHVDATNQFYTIYRNDLINDTYTWVSVVTGGAHGDDSYVFEVSTLMDSTADDDGATEFKVIAYMNEGNFASDVAMGYSVDNLAPDAPTGLMAVIVEEGISLSWDLSSADDFQYFELEKSIFEDFSSVETFTLVDTSYLDVVFELNQPNYYRLSAVDHAGNVSDHSDVIEAAILEIGDDLVPESYALHQNYPNPFNPVTTIRYDLPEDAQVVIRIFDIQGRIVSTLVNGQEDAGRHAVPWNATNSVGEPAAAGMYIYMIQSGRFSQVRKMLLLK